MFACKARLRKCGGNDDNLVSVDYRMLKSNRKLWKSIWQRKGKELKIMKGGKISCHVLLTRNDLA